MTKMANTAYRIIVIDDDPNETTLLREAVSHASLPVEIVPLTGPLAALAFFSQDLFGQVDLIIVDLHLSHQSGSTLVRALQEIPAVSDIPITICSSSLLGNLPKYVSDVLPTPYFTKESTWQGYLFLAHTIVEILANKTVGSTKEDITKNFVARLMSRSLPRL